MEKIGIRGIPLLWFSNYLCNRKMYVDVNGEYSQEMYVDFGVPQGSILGPYLFLIYINDLAECKLKGEVLLYADDTNIFYTADSTELLYNDMKHDLNILEKWFNLNKLCVNTKKCNFILFSSEHNEVINDDKLNFFGSKLSHVRNTKFLGLHLTYNLDWTNHIADICKKISKYVGIFFRVKDLIPYRCKRLLYFSLVHCHLTYLLTIWGVSSENKLHALKILQNKLIKILFDMPIRTHTSDVYKNTNILSISSQLQFSSSLLIKNLILNKVHTNTAILINRDVHTYNTRNSNRPYTFPKKTTTFGTKSCLNNSLSNYNSLNSDIRNIENVKTFKKKLLQFIKEQ